MNMFVTWQISHTQCQDLNTKKKGKLIENSELGYIKSNCVPCCYICNRAKNILSREDFLNWIKRVYNYAIRDVGNSV